MHLSEYTHFNRTRNEHEGVRDNERGITCDCACDLQMWLGGFLVDDTNWNQVLIGGIYIVKVFLKWKELKPHDFFQSLLLHFYSEKNIIL